MFPNSAEITITHNHCRDRNSCQPSLKSWRTDDAALIVPGSRMNTNTPALRK